MARSAMVRVPGEAPKLEEPEAREAPEGAVGDPGSGHVAAPAMAASEESGLPDADSIDARTLRQAVLTRQGWLCPLPTDGAVPGQAAAGR